MLEHIDGTDVALYGYMPASIEHQAITEMIREAPAVVVALLRAAGIDVPAHVEATGTNAAFSIAVDDFNADDAVVLRTPTGETERVVVVEVQRAWSDEKLLTLPIYQAIARRRHKAPCEVLVLALDDDFADALRRPIPLGGGSFFAATVVGRAELRLMPERIARVSPQVAFLRALVLGAEDPAIVLDAVKSFDELPPERAVLYFDLISEALPKAIRLSVEKLMLHQGYQPRSAFVKELMEQWRAEGRREGREEGREEACPVVRNAIRALLRSRHIVITADHEQALEACTDLGVLATWAERAATASSARDVFG
ncbi:MAG: hypothetical protein KF819_37835 [Labilithrix sp.]|nr:hypothetical protein [Labilithrix sp.]